MTVEPLPPPLKIPDVSRFIHRANQLRGIKPAIAYWCEYHAVNQIVTKSLHTADDDCFAFTKSLIERLEATKTERAEDDAVVDNTAGQAYVEQFAQETFSRAERAMRANKVTRQTADTFDAAATFFDLTHEWGTPEAEVLQKIKFAKWNAARILKAIREGRDPNESNPRAEEPQQPEPPLSPSDPAVRAITQSGPRAASVEDADDAGEPYRGPDAQGDYFPPPTEEAPVPSPEMLLPAQSPNGMPSPPAPSQNPPEAPVPTLRPQARTTPSPSIPHSAPKAAHAPGPTAAVPSPAAHSAPAGPSVPVVPTPNPKSIEQAQKHAKWAISALNFEDIPTAVQELRNALALLGCQ
ncbi:hypothetical protein E4U42_003543 [Claviceps africana]|uniref:Vacuolar protein sorting-associated protein VTA1 n=1 Tax=Claviceps africana TaxID=83212 RepID=A0A8K0J928_9HYPO|nr:hypothetical protein E4U42_003543 [Claviceps africana]